LAIGGVRSDTAVAFGTFPVAPVYDSAVHIGSNSRTRLGWVGGGGVEVAVSSNWSVKGEYLYMDFGAYSYASPLVAPAGVAAGYSWTTNVYQRNQLVRLGINYRFGALTR
jgi:outer membrane immunogenic protein